MHTVREESGHLSGHDGVRLFYRTWKPESPRGGLVLVHGMNEHSGRYQHVAEFFCAQGFAVYAMDHRGHGQSEGTRCHVSRFADYLLDLRRFVDLAQEYGKPIMIGHSMGGLISFRYALAHPDTIRALVLSSPLFGVKAKVGAVEKAIAPLISVVLPTLQMPTKIPFENLTRDPERVKAAAADPLFGKTATPRWFIESTKAYLACHQGLCAGLHMPVLFLQAGDDLLVDPEATRSIFMQVPHDRKAFKLYPGKYHEIFNDPGQEEVFADILNWMQEQELISLQQQV